MPMKRRNSFTNPLLICALTLGTQFLPMTGTRVCGETNALGVEVGALTVTNEPLFRAVGKLSTTASVIINTVVDETPHPVISVSKERGPLSGVLSAILKSLPGYEISQMGQTILIAPAGLSSKEMALTKKLPQFMVSYHSYTNRNGEVRYWCDFYDARNPTLNVGFSHLSFKKPPPYSQYPFTRKFENLSLLEILTALSEEASQCWCCGRLDRDYVKKENQEIQEKRMGPAWCPDPNMPCYSVVWWGLWGVEHPNQTTTIPQFDPPLRF